MITYEWCRIENGKYLGYVNDEQLHIKMIAIGPSHTRLCHNFSTLLYRSNKYNRISPNRFVMAMEENKELYDKFKEYKRGGFINDNDMIIKTVKEKREEARVEREEIDKIKSQLLEQNRLEESFDRFTTETNENGDILVYGIKLVKVYKNKGVKNEETSD